MSQRHLVLQPIIVSTSILTLSVGCVTDEHIEKQTDTTPPLEIHSCLSVKQESILCDENTALSYVERSAEYGLTLTETIDTVGISTPLLLHDFNADGYPDLLMYNINGQIDHYQGRDGYFERVSQIQTDSISVSFALLDFNHDGVLDFVYSTETVLVLYANVQGTLEFHSVVPFDGMPTNLTPWYINDDHYLDLYIGGIGHRHPDQIMISSEESFSENSLELDIVGSQGMNFLSLPIDINDDNKAEMYIVNDFLPPPEQPQNPDDISEGSTIFNISPEYTVDNEFAEDCFCTLEVPGMGASQADYNLDGNYDIFIAASFGNYLLTGDAHNSFVDTSIQSGISPGLNNRRMWWGTSWTDFNNDTLPDIISVGGDFYKAFEMAPTESFEIDLFIQQPDHTFVKTDVGLHDRTHRYNRGVITWDFNHDGVQDILISTVAEAPKLYISEGCNTNNWVRIDTVEGATVEITVQNQTYKKFVSSVTGVYATVTPHAYFGLGDATEIDKIEIQFQNGTQSAVFDGPFPINSVLQHTIYKDDCLLETE